MGQLSYMAIGILLSLTIIIGFFALINEIMQSGLYDLIISGLNFLVYLFGTGPTIIFLSLFTLAGMTLVIRFIMSWLGENPGHSANS